MPVVAGARVGEHGCKEGLRVRERPEMLAHPTAEAGSSPARSRSSPERWREVEDASDGRDPPVSGRVRESARGPRGRALAGRLGPGPSRPPVQHSALSLFPFWLKMLDV